MVFTMVALVLTLILAGIPAMRMSTGSLRAKVRACNELAMSHELAMSLHYALQ